MDENEMKDFTYYADKTSLHIDGCNWLEDMGLRETRWILDAEWLSNVSVINPPYNIWIYR